jgi:folate-binding protein YgfZ
MLHETPLRKRHESYVRREEAAQSAGEAAGPRTGAAVGRRAAAPEVAYIDYGLPEDGAIACRIPATFGQVEAEYAAIRRAAGLLDCPQRATLRVTGAGRIEFLNRMVTQELNDLRADCAAEAFWLNRKGRIEADLLLIELGEEMFIEVDIHQAARCVQTLEQFILAEDVQIVDCCGDYHHIAVHGPAARRVIAIASGDDTFALEPLAAKRASINGVDVIIARRDQTGESGFEIITPYHAAETVWDALLGADEAVGQGRRRVRPVGWWACNIARIEAGTPLMNIDFGTTNLPHETGVLDRRVSFTKGCFLGQEIVARLDSRGRPRQKLAGLRMPGDRLPVAGAQVFEKTAAGRGEPIGLVTSSTISPMLGATPIAFAMMSTAPLAENATVLVNAEGQVCEATIGPLRFWTAPSDRSG